MNPKEFSAKLLKLARDIESAKNPSRQKVAAALGELVKRVASARAPFHGTFDHPHTWEEVEPGDVRGIALLNSLEGQPYTVTFKEFSPYVRGVDAGGEIDTIKFQNGKFSYDSKNQNATFSSPILNHIFCTIESQIPGLRVME